MERILLRLENIKKYFPIRKGIFYRTTGFVKAVDGFSLNIKEGEILGLVGESGCGKSTLAKTILRLYEPDSGKIFFEDKDITKIKLKDLRKLRKKMQIVFQDPFSSLDPKFRIRKIILEAIDAFSPELSKEEKEAKIREILEEVKLPLDCGNRFPHEFSGGQRQRIAIARSLVLNPKFLILDEPVSALDVIIQLEILNLLQRLKEKFNLSYLFISHNLKVIQKISDRICVMYLGKLIELGSKESVFKEPLHPYTSILVSAEQKRFSLKEELKSTEISSGCRFHQRCPHPKDICKKAEPLLEEKKPFHLVSCHYPLG